MRLRCSAAVVGAVAFAATFYPAPAQAFCRTTTETDSDVCTTSGEPLAWRGGCVSYSVHRDGSSRRDIDYDTIHDITRLAFDRWTNADCRPGTPSIAVLDLSPATCGEHEYNQSQPNANVIMFRDEDWPYDDIGAALALTQITFNTETGEIFDADIEVNSFETRLSTSDSVIDYDLESILTHEVGHFLGLAHSNVAGATMVTWYDGGHLSLRSLAPDDEAGLCAVYPPDQPASNDDCRPRHGFSPDCASPRDDDGCAVGTSPTGSTRSWPLLLGAPIVVAARRRRPPRSA